MTTPSHISVIIRRIKTSLPSYNDCWRYLLCRLLAPPSLLLAGTTADSPAGVNSLAVFEDLCSPLLTCAHAVLILTSLNSPTWLKTYYLTSIVTDNRRIIGLWCLCRVCAGTQTLTPRPDRESGEEQKTFPWGLLDLEQSLLALAPDTQIWIHRHTIAQLGCESLYLQYHKFASMRPPFNWIATVPVCRWLVVLSVHAKTPSPLPPCDPPSIAKVFISTCKELNG